MSEELAQVSWLLAIMVYVIVGAVVAFFAYLLIGAVVGAVRWVVLSLRDGDAEDAWAWWFLFLWAEDLPMKLHEWWAKRRAAP